jgi:hypothetical protein
MRVPISLPALPIQMLLFFLGIRAFVFVCALPAVCYAAQFSFFFCRQNHQAQLPFVVPLWLVLFNAVLLSLSCPIWSSGCDNNV